MPSAAGTEARVPDAALDMVLAYGGPLSYAFDQEHQALAGLLRIVKLDGGTHIRFAAQRR